MVYAEHQEMKLNRVSTGKKEMNNNGVALSLCPFILDCVA